MTVKRKAPEKIHAPAAIRGPAMDSFLDINDLDAWAKSKGVYPGSDFKRWIRAQQTAGRIPKPVLVKNPRGRGRVALYPPQTTEIILGLRNAENLQAYHAARASAQASAAQLQARVMLFENALAEWLREQPHDVRVNLLVETDAEYGNGRGLPIELCARKVILFNIPDEKLDTILSEVFDAGYAKYAPRAPVGNWPDPIVADAYRRLDDFQSLYVLLSRGDISTAYSDLRVQMYIAWILQTRMLRKYGSRKLNG